MKVEKSSFLGRKNRRQVFTMTNISRVGSFTFAGKFGSRDTVINMVFDKIHLRIYPA